MSEIMGSQCFRLYQNPDEIAEETAGTLLSVQEGSWVQLGSLVLVLFLNLPWFPQTRKKLLCCHCAFNKTRQAGPAMIVPMSQ